jgi:hypothetical protein
MCKQCYVWIYDFVDMMGHSLKNKERLRQYLPSVTREILHDLEPVYMNKEYRACTNIIGSIQYDQITYIESAFPSVKELIDCLESILDGSRIDTREVLWGWLRQVITIIFLSIGSIHEDHSGSFKTLMGTSPSSEAFSEKLE